MNRPALALSLALVAGCTPPAPPPDPEPRALLDQAREALRARKPADAVAPLLEASAMAEKMRPGPKRIDALSEAGRLFWSANRRDLAEKTLLSAARQIESSPKAASAETVAQTYWMLGVVYRDLGRSPDAIAWFERTIQANGALPEASPVQASMKYMSLASSVQALADAQCRAGQGPAAEATDQARMAACGKLRNPGSVGACNVSPRSCTRGGVMRGEKRIW